MVMQTIAMLVTLAVPIIFVASGMDIIPAHKTDATMIGVITAVAAGMFWILTGQVRTLFFLPKHDASDTEIEEMQEATKVGTLIRMLATIVVFGCPILLIINNYQNHDDEIKFAAIVCGIVGVAMIF
jgi:hypothetical protein